MMNMKVLLAHVLHNYNVEATIDVSEWDKHTTERQSANVLTKMTHKKQCILQRFDRRMRPLPEIISRPPNGYPMKLKRRY